MRVAFITTAPEALCSFLAQQIRLLDGEGYEVHTITSPGLDQFADKSGIPSVHHEITMTRTMHPFADALSLWRLVRLLHRIRPDVVQTHTPKAGLLGMLAAFLTRVPIRIYTINGLPIRVQKFCSRLVLGMTERLACVLATEVLCVSRSVRRVVIGSGFCPSEKCRTLGDGGSHGVDTHKFNPDVYGSASREQIRKQYGIPNDALVLGYIGRIVPAKGINDLALAWSILRDKFSELRLLICGYCEPEHPMDPTLLERLRSDRRVHFTGQMVRDMPPIYAALDVSVLPTHCEGLPNVVLEAAAMRVTTVATRVPGCVDAIRNGTTGLLVEPRNPRALAEALHYLIGNSEVRQRMGFAARDYVTRRFSEARTSTAILERYRAMGAALTANPKTTHSDLSRPSSRTTRVA